MPQQRERPELTYEAFVIMAKQIGFHHDDPHLEDLYPEVRLLLQRVAALDDAQLAGVEPGTVYRVTGAP
jgi:hypothetical protein